MWLLCRYRFFLKPLQQSKLWTRHTVMHTHCIVWFLLEYVVCSCLYYEHFCRLHTDFLHLLRLWLNFSRNCSWQFSHFHCQESWYHSLVWGLDFFLDSLNSLIRSIWTHISITSFRSSGCFFKGFLKRALIFSIYPRVWTCIHTCPSKTFSFLSDILYCPISLNVIVVLYISNRCLVSLVLSIKSPNFSYRWLLARLKVLKT